MSPTEAGKVFSRLVLFIELQYIFVLKLTRGKKNSYDLFGLYAGHHVKNYIFFLAQHKQ